MNILIVRNDKIGDFITALPACYLIKQHLPDCQITVLISAVNQSIAKLCPFIDHIIIDDGKSAYQLAQQLKQHHFDLSITMFSNTRLALAQYLARIPKRYAPATKIAQVFYNHRILQRRSQVNMAEFEYNIQLTAQAFPHINTHYPTPLLNLKLSQPHSESHQKIIAFHPGSGGSSDANWTVQEYITLAQSIAHLPHIHIIFTFGPGDEQCLQAFQQHQGDLPASIHVSQGSLAEFTALIASFALFVSTSTGTFHLASAVGTPTMTFFADTLFASAKRWKGIGDTSLQHNLMIPKSPEARSLLFQQAQKKIFNLADHLT